MTRLRRDSGKLTLLLGVILPGVFLLSSCARGLPRALHSEIRTEAESLRAAEQEVQRSADSVVRDLKDVPDLFAGTAVANEWPTRLNAAQQKLAEARQHQKELDKLARENRADTRPRTENLLAEERTLRETALHDTQTVEAAANKWLSFHRNLPYYLGNLEHEYAAAKAVDLEPVAKAVAQAEQDWPAKKGDLDSRLTALRAEPEKVDAQWKESEAARKEAASGKASGAAVAELIKTDDLLSQEATEIPKDAKQLTALTGQLYDSWDKVLSDLSVEEEGPNRVYREKLRTVRTHLTDVAAKKSEIKSDEQWVDVPESSYRAVEKDLGMAIAHKDAGLYDSEATNTPQPAGFAYIAPPSQGSNQYGYWTTDSGGNSFWTFLPQYLLMRELFWGHDYRPIIVNEYNGYRTAQQSGRTYYGTESGVGAPSAPKYGSHGSFTQNRYANSRYVQSGGFKDSAYASGGGYRGSGYASPGASSGSGYSPSRSGSSSSSGHQFGSSSSSSGGSSDSSSGHRFGSGSSSSGSSSGKKFGSSSSSHSSGRSFGRRH